MRTGDINPSTHSCAEAFEQRNAITGWVLAVALTVAAFASMWRCSEVLADAALISHFRSRPVQAYVPSPDEGEFKDFARYLERSGEQYGHRSATVYGFEIVF